MPRPEPRVRSTTRRLAVAVTALGLTMPTAVLLATPAEAHTGSDVTVSDPGKARPQGLRVQWRRTNVIAGNGNPFRVTGNVPRGWKGRQVVLQRKRHGGWMRANATRIKPNGSFVLTARSNWIHTQPYRIRITNPQGKTLTRRKQFKARPPWKPVGKRSSWKLLTSRWDGRPVRYRWNPCGAPIRYRVNLTHARAGQTLSDVRRAVGTVALATGLRFKFRGRTTAHAFGPASAHPDDADLLISWSNNRQATQAPFGARSSTIGYGGLWGMDARDARGRVIRAEGGSVALRANFNWQGNREAAYVVLLHELAHAVGVDHVNDPTQLMNGSLTPSTPSHFGAGDLTALTRVGLSEGCVFKPSR